ncbi:MAG: TetR/AcrR family transcriptional regulator [Chloroflexi bacterium]|nr:TetR/AcrR family transcriptional regulator [Chloroflexota bacterium]
MAERGVAGLNLAEVAKRMGIRPPSLYKYFPSKMAIYDRLFGDGMRAWKATLGQTLDRVPPDRSSLQTIGSVLVEFAVECPVRFQLLFWRTVPGFEPSPESYATAIETWQMIRQHVHSLVGRGELVLSDSSEDAIEDGMWIASSITLGVITNQLANEPGVPAKQGRFTRLLPTALGVLLDHYAPKPVARSRKGIRAANMTRDANKRGYPST